MKSLTIPVGAAAPDFELPSTDGRARTLTEFRGRSLILVFYRGHW